MKILIKPKSFILGLLGLAVCLYGISPYNITGNVNLQFGVAIVAYGMFLCLFIQEFNSVIIRKNYLLIYIYPIYLFVCYFINWSVRGEAIFSLVYTTIPLFLLLMIEAGEIRWIKTINTFTTVYIVAVCLFTIYMLHNNPLISRLLAAAEYWKSLNITELIFTGGFDFIYSIVLIAGIYLYLARDKNKTKNKKIVYYMCYAICAVCIVMSLYTTAILLLVLDSLCILYFSLINKSRNFTILFVIITLLIILCFFNIVPILSALKGLAPSTGVSERLDDIINILNGSGLGGHALGRSVVYTYSINTWLDNFWFGIGYNGFNTRGSRGIGGHSEILDHLGYYGIIGTILFIYTLYKTYKILKNSLGKKNEGMYRLTFVIFLIELLMNPGYTFSLITAMFFIVPSLLFISNSFDEIAENSHS